MKQRKKLQNLFWINRWCLLNPAFVYCFFSKCFFIHCISWVLLVWTHTVILWYIPCLFVRLFRVFLENHSLKFSDFLHEVRVPSNLESDSVRYFQKNFALRYLDQRAQIDGVFLGSMKNWCSKLIFYIKLQ